jgi:transcriptional regulator with GAF, ATPase, and Fis domain
VLRQADLQDFSPEDRVLLQAICQLWVRGLAKTNRLQELRVANEQLRAKSGLTFLGNSPALIRLREQARKAAATQASILLTGETGSGKEVLAQFIHDSSPRNDGPLVKVNCAAIPDSLIESELFGFAKGAFSGANQEHRGKFVQAHNGTLFLDEVGEMPLLVQAKTLRAIETREVSPLGSETPQQCNLRIIAATNKDLRAMVKQKEFREDLYYRLDVQRLRVPPLREHLEDIDELAPHFLIKFCAENGLAEMSLEPGAVKALKEYDWPGNVRELWNVIQRCALAAEERTIAEPNVKEQLHFL